MPRSTSSATTRPTSRSSSSAGPTVWSSPRAPAPRPRRGSPSRRSASSPRPVPRSSASASGISRWLRPSAAASSRASRSTARTPRSSTTAGRSLPASRTPCVAGRYHSLIADPALPDDLELTATLDEVVMAARHRHLPAEGVQFHPESVLTPQGKPLLANFLDFYVARERRREGRMPNHVLTRAIDAICAGDHLTTDHTGGGPHRDHGGPRRPGADRRLPDRPAGQGRDGARAGRAGADDALAGGAGRIVRPTWSIRPAPAAAPRPSTSPPRRPWSRPAPAAPSPSTATAPHQQVRIRRPAGGARRQHRARPRRRSAAASMRSASASCSRPATTRRWPTLSPSAKSSAVRTIFNFLGPLTNPAGAERQLLGVADRHYQETIAEALVGLGQRAGDGRRRRGRARRALDLLAAPG